MDPLTSLLADAGLTGRGGAAFSTATKLEAARDHRADLIVNACDGELGAAKDGWVVEHHLPELVEGAGLVAGRRRVRFAAHRGSHTAERLHRAGLDVLEAPPRYVSSEESALVNLAHGGLARPVTKRQPVTRGGHDASGRRLRPTLVLNAETTWRVAQVARNGVDWFRGFGTPDEPGPRLVAVSTPRVWGHVVQTEAGAPLASILDAAGGLAPDAPAVLVGGLGGAFVPTAAATGLAWSGADLAPHGATLGPGVVEVLAARDCPLEFVDRCLTWAAGESAGQCGPCMFGLPALATDWHGVVRGDPSATARVRYRIGLLPGRGACRFPDGVARFAATALHVLAAHVAAHEAGHCPTRAHATDPTDPAHSRSHHVLTH
ncbi:NADH-ubiquinone oxidoreductase-F iron-sulfur binding region domain-containing protein [Intrasporangium sp. YIM S08009]|uniref:NADH-ubiquinone oxidoreductase-F iron-sulfur binding region domain-containing protein n=1 Tax=Intrasporangium zincisolvens TaxID=3080018 RepID=UPI002B052C84|nr:NADH-ubiquinone oxidoreductase-F iron-sulfur binding region domain-containing protein [Intrasporangium sp. YIM S08009]